MMHVNPKTGETGVCKAKSQESCPFGVEFHFATQEEINNFNDYINQSIIKFEKDVEDNKPSTMSPTFCSESDLIYLRRMGFEPSKETKGRFESPCTFKVRELKSMKANHKSEYSTFKSEIQTFEYNGVTYAVYGLKRKRPIEIAKRALDTKFSERALQILSDTKFPSSKNLLFALTTHNYNYSENVKRKLRELPEGTISVDSETFNDVHKLVAGNRFHLGCFQFQDTEYNVRENIIQEKLKEQPNSPFDRNNYRLQFIEIEHRETNRKTVFVCDQLIMY